MEPANWEVASDCEEGPYRRVWRNVIKGLFDLELPGAGVKEFAETTVKVVAMLKVNRLYRAHMDLS